MDVRFAPASAGSRKARLRMLSDDAARSPLTVSLSGAGCVSVGGRPCASPRALDGALMAAAVYCLSNTKVVFTVSPFAFLPVSETVRVLPSAETTTFVVMVTFPSFFQTF